MRVPIVVPQLGAAAETVRVNGWFVEAGDRIVEGDLLVELLITGITFDLAAEVSGVIIEISQPLGGEVRSGNVLGWMKPAISDLEDSIN